MIGNLIFKDNPEETQCFANKSACGTSGWISLTKHQEGCKYFLGAPVKKSTRAMELLIQY